MALYHYQAVTPDGKMLSGEREAANRDVLIAELHHQGQVPIRAVVAGGSFLARWAQIQLFKPRAGSTRQLVMLTEQLATLLQAGLALDRTLEIAKDVMAKEADRDLVQRVLDRLRGGGTLGDALAAQGDYFPRFYIGMVRAGEAGATLDATLRQIASYLAKSAATEEATKSALLYPVLVMATGIGTIGILLGVVVPQLHPLLDQGGPALPMAARAVFAASDLLRDDGTLLLALLALIGLGVVAAFRQPAVRSWWDRQVLRAPLVGAIAVRIEIERFARTLGTLLRSGLAPLSALTIAREAVGNSAVADALASLGPSLKEGKGLATPLASIACIPALAAQLVRAGEEAGRLDDMLLKTADIFEADARRSIDRLVAATTPAVTILLGVVVAAVVGSLLTAILSLYDLAG